MSEIKLLSTPFKEDKENKFKLFYQAAHALNGAHYVGAQPYMNGNYIAHIGIGSSIGYIYNITNNCQIASLSSFYSILNSSDCNKFLKWIYNTLLEVGHMKPQLIIDVQRQYSDKVDKMFGNYIVFKNDYTSTNNSNMTMYLIKSEGLKNLKD